MEKSGRIQLTYDQLKRYNRGEELPEVLKQWEISTMAELTKILDSGQYEVVEVY